jgi:hypothetical protein
LPCKLCLSASAAAAAAAVCGCQVRVGVLDKEAAELRDEVAALQQRLAAFDEAAVRDFAAKVGQNLVVFSNSPPDTEAALQHHL